MLDISPESDRQLYSDVTLGYFRDIDELITKKGAMINFKHGPKGETVLMLAIRLRDRDLINLFIDKYKASTLIQNYEGEDALDLSREWGNQFAIEKIKRKAILETKDMTHDDIFRIVARIISDIIKIPENKIYPKSDIEKDLYLYEGREYLSPNSKVWILIETIENRFKLDSRKMDPKYRILFDPEIPQKPNVWGLVEIIMSEIANRDEITI